MRGNSPRGEEGRWYAPRVSDAQRAALNRTRTPADDPRDEDWLLRIPRAASLPPAWLGPGAVAAYLLVFVGLSSLLGAAPLGWQWELVNALVVGWLLAADAVAVDGALRDLRGLRPLLSCGEGEFRELLRRALRAPLWFRAGAAGLTLVIAGLMVAYDPGIWPGRRRPGASDPEFLWVLLRNVVMGLCIARVTAREVFLTRGFSRVGERVRIDLLDAGPLAPFARKGQRSVVVWVGFTVLFSLYWLGGAAARSNLATVIAILALLATCFVLPLLSLRRRIVAAKQSELERIHRELRAGREGGGESDARLAYLLAWRAAVEDVREWPVNAPTLIRSLLLAALGLGSWLGGALVERLLGALLD